MNIPVTRAAEGLARRSFTIVDMERMQAAGIIGSEERLELLGGEIVPMSPKGSRHESLKIAIARFWGRVCPPEFVWAPETGLYLDQHNYVEPDFIMFERHVRIGNVKGPDVLLSVEVADSSLDYDLNRKSLLYALFGVGELWVIDAARRKTHVFHDAGQDGYASVEARSADERLVPVHAAAALAFALNDLDEI